MDDRKKLYILTLQKEAKYKLGSGTLQGIPQLREYIEGLLQKILENIDEKRITDAIQKYYDDQKIIEDQMEKLSEEYSKNINDIYEMIKKL
jgi:ribosomal protein L16 Arg81 hydroxylase